MGGSYIKERTKPIELVTHPSFSVPEIPYVNRVTKNDFDTIVKWALEVAARFVSPNPKEDGEDESFECEDAADAIRNQLTEMLKTKMGGRMVSVGTWDGTERWEAGDA